MANPYAGEMSLTLGGERHVCKLTLGALAELEHALGDDCIVSLVDRFEQGRFSARDILALITAGLRGGGWAGDQRDLITAEIDGGMAEAARVAARLLVLAFEPFGAR